MSKMIASIKMGLLALGGVLSLVGALFLFAGATTFSTWPWTKTETYTSGTALGFEVGTSKRNCFDNAIIKQQAGGIRALQLVDAEPGTHEQRFKGTNLTDEDFEAARVSDVWNVGLTGENAWLLLEFEEGQLKKIVKKKYRGPTE